MKNEQKKENFLIGLSAAVSTLQWPTLNTKPLYKYFPDNAFGVFTTIKRSKSQKLEKWPEDIHGCIGQWTPNFKVATPEELNNWTLQTAKQATWEDTRKEYFKELYLDVNATIEVQFLLLPLTLLHNQTGYEEQNKYQKFNNATQGLLLINKNDNRGTTYLPRVFQSNNYDWTDIKNSLIGKSTSKNRNQKEYKQEEEEKEYKFYSYHTKEINFPLNFLFQNKLVFQYYWKQGIRNFINFLEADANHFIPIFSITSKGQGDVVYDSSEIVRNLSVMQIYKMFINSKNEKYDSYIESLLALFRLGSVHPLYPKPNELACLKIYLDKTLIKYKYEYEDIHEALLKLLLDNWKNLEPVFTLGQVILSILPPTQQKKLKPIQQLDNVILEILQFWSDSSSSIHIQLKMEQIFQLNWQVQTLLAISNYYSYHQENQVLFQVIQEYIQKIRTRWLPFLYQQIENWKNLETNYLVVALEVVSALRSHRRQELIAKKLEEETEEEEEEENLELKILLTLFNHLQRDYFNETKGFYYFKNSTARLDITCHVISSLLFLFPSLQSLQNL